MLMDMVHGRNDVVKMDALLPHRESAMLLSVHASGELRKDEALTKTIFPQ
jgi:hypothetical protein